MTTVRGYVRRGIGDFRKRMTAYADVFRRATGEQLYPGTLNVRVASRIRVKEDFRIIGADIGEPEQDLLFERCAVNGLPAYRIRPYNLRSGAGGHGDDTIEIASAHRIPNADAGATIEITFFRDDIPA